MPILIHVDELEPGMRLAANLMNQYSLLRPAGHVITEQDKVSLLRLMPQATLEIADPILDEKFQFQNTEESAAVSREVCRNVSAMMQKVSETIRSGTSLDAKNIAGLKQAINELLETIQSHRITTVLLEQSSKWEGYLQEHSANVFYLSMVLGNTIRNYIKAERERLSHARQVHNAMNLSSLGMAAMFHDIGMLAIENLLQKNAPLTPEEIAQIRQHPRRGADMLPEDMDAMSRLVIGQHHENADGSGYPDGLTGAKTAIFARIIRVADAYSAAIANKAWQPGKLPAQVVHEMVYGAYKRCYDPIILKVFANIVHPFPIGAKLQLLNNRCAIVIKQNPKNTFVPEVVVAFDELGDPLPESELKAELLGNRPDLRIKSYCGHDMTFLNEPLPDNVPPSSINYSSLQDMFYP